MGLQEVARRVLLGHWIVILIFIAAGVGGVSAFHFLQAPTYTASTRLVLDAPPPTSGTEAQALADSAKAIVTSPSHVEQALVAAGVVRDPVVVIQNITLVPLGTSGVLLLSVQDRDAAASAAIANALAKDLIKTRLAVSVAAQRATLDDRIAAANAAITDLDQQIATLDAQLESLQVDPSNVQTASVRAQILADRISALSSERSSLTQQELQLEAERNSLDSNGSIPTPSIIDPASVPARPDASRLPFDLALGLVIGLILGVAVASTLEMFGPTLSSGEVIAGSLGVPVLGSLPDPAGTLRDRLRLVASAHDLTAIELLGVGETPNLSALAKSLDGPAQGSTNALSVFSSEDAPARYRSGTASPPFGFVLVVPDQIRKAALDPVRDLLGFSGRPLLGVVVHDPFRRAKESQPIAKHASPHLAVVGKDGADPVRGMSSEVVSDLWGGR
jgi:uncharacterized protein involved in exopolysaccharide biosynthesis